jgi:uncharacterized protein
MKIRTVTAFVSLQETFDEEYVVAALEFLNHEASVFTAAGFEVQTKRLVFNNPAEWLLTSESGALKAGLLPRLSELLDKFDVPFCSVGRLPTRFAHIAPEIVLAGDTFNTSVIVDRADVQGALAVAQACQRIAAESDGGMGNFRFCATMNFADDSFCPFFPASFGSSAVSRSLDTGAGERNRDIHFAIGLENGSDFQEACKRAKTMKKLGDEMIAVFAPTLLSIQELCLSTATTNFVPTSGRSCSLKYAGIDTSLNPALGSEGSIGYGFELLEEITSFGRVGASLAAVAEATMTCQHGFEGILLTGYCGCMLPLCEDEQLALSNLDARDLLSLSSTCGVGIDTVPLGFIDFNPMDLAYLYLDAAAVAFRKQRPLSVRVFPVPGLSSGDMTTFNNPYLTNASCRKL